MKKGKDPISRLINIDSRGRDRNKYVNENDYRFTFQYPMRNVERIDLVSAEIPKTDFNIKEENNKLDLVDNGNAETITVPVGDYTDETLRSQLETQLNGLGHSTWTVSIDNGKYTFSSTNNFSFLFSSGTNADKIKTLNQGFNFGYLEEKGSIRSILGFNINDTASGTTVSSDNKINLEGERYIILDLGFDEKNLAFYDYTGKSAFGKIALTSNLNDTTFYSENLYDISRYYDPIIERVPYIHVRFLTYGGTLYNFRGHNHSFTLRVTTRE